MNRRNLFLFIFVCLSITISIFFYKSSYKRSYYSGYDSEYGHAFSYKDIVRDNGDIIKEIVNLKDGRKKSSAEEILDYALLALKSNYSFNENTENILKQISGTYKKIGNIKKASLAEKLERITGTMFLHECYEPYAAYEEEWFKAKKLLNEEQFDEAIKISQRNPYVLAKIASVYLESGQKEKADDLLVRAYKEATNSTDNYLKGSALREIVSIYKKAEEYDKAIYVINNMPAGYRDAEISNLAKVFSKKGRFDDVFKLLNDINVTIYKVGVLIDIANKYNENNLELDNNKREILRKIVHLAK